MIGNEIFVVDSEIVNASESKEIAISEPRPMCLALVNGTLGTRNFCCDVVGMKFDPPSLAFTVVSS